MVITQIYVMKEYLHVATVPRFQPAPMGQQVLTADRLDVAVSPIAVVVGGIIPSQTRPVVNRNLNWLSSVMNSNLIPIMESLLAS